MIVRVLSIVVLGILLSQVSFGEEAYDYDINSSDQMVTAQQMDLLAEGDYTQEELDEYLAVLTQPCKTNADCPAYYICVSRRCVGE